jgi:hypothetical protein
MKRLSLSLAAVLLAPYAYLQAQTVTTTDPLGYVAFPITAGTAAAPSTTLLSIPLQDENALRVSVAQALSGTEVKIANVEWAAGEWTDPDAPAYLRVLSGAQAGATRAIVGNTADSLTLDSALAGVGVGDLAEIVSAATLGNLFGDTLLGGASARESDNIVTADGATYYYNSERGRWERDTDPNVSQDEVILRPDTGFFLVRRGPAFQLISAGRVPITAARTLVANQGASLITYGFPADVTIGQLALQNAIPGWRSHANAASADWLSIHGGYSYLVYYHTGTNWRRTTGAPTNRDSIVIKAGTPLLLTRGAAPGSAEYTKAKPY